MDFKEMLYAKIPESLFDRPKPDLQSQSIASV